MARIRSIKPEFWTSEQVVELSPTTRLLFIGMWTFCDDRGIHPASCKTLKMEVFPGDDFTSSDIEQMMAAIIQAGLVLEYQGIDGKYYWAVTGWDKHQKVEKPNYKHPAPPKFADQSPTNRRPIADQSTPEGKGGEGRGRGKELEGRGGEFAETPPAPPDNFENENTPTTTTPSNTFAQIRADIQKWQDADNGAALRKIAADQKYMGPIEPEITRFISHNLKQDPYRARITRAPLDFFLEQFPGWLCLPAAQRASKAQTTGSAAQQNGSYTAPVQRDQDADQHISESEAIALIAKHAGDYAGNFTKAHISNVRSKISRRSAIDLILAISTTIQKSNSSPPNGNAHEISTHGLKLDTA